VNHDGTVSKKELVLGLTVLTNGTTEQKLRKVRPSCFAFLRSSPHSPLACRLLKSLTLIALVLYLLVSHKNSFSKLQCISDSLYLLSDELRKVLRAVGKVKFQSDAQLDAYVNSTVQVLMDKCDTDKNGEISQEGT